MKAILCIALAFLFITGCGKGATPTLVPTLEPLKTLNPIALTNEAVIATNAAIETAIITSETAEAGISPTWTPKPTRTPQPTNTLVVQAKPTNTAPAIEAPTRTPVPTSEISEAEFKAYLRKEYSTIAGQLLDVERISIFVDEDPQFPSRIVSIILTQDSGLYVFGEQTEAAAMEYANRLLQDTKAYFRGKECSAYVSESHYSRNLQDHHFDEEWWYIGDYDIDDGWYVSKTYVKAFFLHGYDDIDVWNYR